MGTKYIIEVEDKPFHKEDGDFLYRVKGFNSLVFDMTGISKLIPYTEPDLERVKKTAHDDGYSEGYQAGREDLNQVMSQVKKDYDAFYENGYQRGLSDAWEAARKIVIGDINIIVSVFSTTSRSIIIRDLAAAEVIEKLKDYEQKQDAEIKIGNEVKAFEKKPFIVTGFGYGDDGEDVYCHGFVTENGISTSAKKNSCVRTGRHFDEIASIFKKMRNESNEQIDT